MFHRIRDRHANALKELKSMATSWDALETVMVDTGDEHRFYGVQARLLQQQNDAAVFRNTILGYYQNLSGLVF